MDIPVHNQILWQACDAARETGGLRMDPRTVFPLLVRGSWLTDTNQASLVTALAPQKAQPAFHAFVRGLWNAELDELLGEFCGPDAPRSAQEVRDALLKTRNAVPAHADDIGSYNPQDHHDVCAADEAPTELAHAAGGLPGLRIQRSVSHAIDRLRRSTTGGADRFGWAALTTLGRALHTLQDYFAHSNHVELLLWSLRPELAPPFVSTFHDRGSFLDSEKNERCYCPLPLAAEVGALTQRNTMFWYGPSAEETPLVSTLFDTTDTACSFLDMIAAHLEDVGGQQFTAEDLDLVLAVFDVPGRRLAVGVWKVYQAFSGVLESIGRGVRAGLADYLRQMSEKGGGAAGALRTAATIVETYDTREAKEWARAGQLRYVSYTLRRSLATELFRDGGAAPFRLPHHTLLCKDHELPGDDEQARFRLACLLATRMTTELIRWHFSAAPDIDEAKEIIGRYIRHPARLTATWPKDRRRNAAAALERAVQHNWRAMTGSLDGVFA